MIWWFVVVVGGLGFLFIKQGEFDFSVLMALVTIIMLFGIIPVFEWMDQGKEERRKE